jgi:probable F420-dependent oxidoreductase
VSGVRVGVGLPNGGLAPDPVALVELAVHAEQLGFDSVWALDRWLRPTTPVRIPGVPVPVQLPADAYRAVLDPIELLTFIAARTTRITLGTSAINVLYQPPVLLARRLATLDQLSDGRLLAGVTSGWMHEEFVAAGVPPAAMGAGFDEHLAGMRRCWGPDPVSFSGARFTIPEADVGPKPRRGTIPLLVGYTTQAGVRRAARIADGLHPYRNDAEQLAADVELFRRAATALGRDPDQLPIVLRAAATTAPDAARDQLFNGPVESWVEDLERLAALGVGHVLLQVDDDLPSTRVTLEALAHLRPPAEADGGS